MLPGGEEECQDCTCSVRRGCIRFGASRFAPVRAAPAQVMCVLSFPQRGEVVCARRRCPVAPCPHPALDGCECGVCDGCSFYGRGCFNGERFPHPADRCQLCSCLVPTCTYLNLYYPSIQKQAAALNLNCKKLSCLRLHRLFTACCTTTANNYVKEPMLMCVCVQNGDVECAHVPCPNIACVHPVTPPGECCPLCTGLCRYQGKEYQSGSSFSSPSDPCSSCSCLVGLTLLTDGR